MSSNTAVFFRCAARFLVLILVVGAWAAPAFAMRTEFTPFVHVSEDYSDNYNQTSTNQEEEFYTTYGAGFTFTMKDKITVLDLTYDPEFEVHKNFTEEDTWQHNASLVGDIALSRRAGIYFDLSRDGNGDGENKKNESWQHTASLGGHYELSKYTGITFSQDYDKTFDRVQRTGEWKEQETSTTSAGMTHQFGRDNSFGFNYSYEFNNYADPDEDEFKQHTPSAFLSFWFTPLVGFDSNFSYEALTHEVSDNDSDTYNGDLRLIKKLTRHFQVYLKYEHTYTQEDLRDHTVYNPSLGFDWEITEDSGLSLGVGYLFHEWENQDDDSSIFFDVDAYKYWDFSEKGSLALTAASGYDASDEDAASLGFHLYYQAGYFLNYQLTKRLSTSFNGSYIIDQYDEPDVDRVDKTLDLGTSLTWTILKSLSVNASYSFVDLATDDEPSTASRENSIGAGLSWIPVRWMRVSLDYSYTDYSAENDEDYQENKGTLMVHLSPARPARLDLALTRGDIENKIYHDR